MKRFIAILMLLVSVLTSYSQNEMSIFQMNDDSVRFGRSLDSLQWIRSVESKRLLELTHDMTPADCVCTVIRLGYYQVVDSIGNTSGSSSPSYDVINGITTGRFGTITQIGQNEFLIVHDLDSTKLDEAYNISDTLVKPLPSGYFGVVEKVVMLYNQYVADAPTFGGFYGFCTAADNTILTKSEPYLYVRNFQIDYSSGLLGLNYQLLENNNLLWGAGITFEHDRHRIFDETSTVKLYVWVNIFPYTVTLAPK